MTERMEQEAMGFGFRNFWASIIKKSIIEINKKKIKSGRLSTAADTLHYEKRIEQQDGNTGSF
jgi:hypothetical protein